MSRSILYGEVVSAAAKVAAMMLPGSQFQFSTNGGHTAAVAKTSGNTYSVALPSLPATARLSRTEANFILGLLVHELGHVRYTDFAWPEDVKAEKDLFHMMNSLEDCREEREVMNSAVPPNGSVLLTDVTETMSLRAAANGGAKAWAKYRPAEAVSFAVVMLGRMANPAYGPMPATTSYSASIPPIVAALVQGFMHEITSTASTAEVIDLARRMLAAANALPVVPRKPEKAKDGDQPTEGGQGGDKTGDGDGKAPTGPAPDKEDEPDKDEPDGDEPDGEAPTGSDAGDKDGEAKDGDGKAGKGGKSGSTDKTPDEAPKVNPADVLADMLRDRASPEEQYAGRFSSLVSSLDSTTHENDKREAKKWNSATMAAQHRASVNTAGISPKVRQMLHSQDDCLTTRYETRGRLDRRSLTRQTTGDPRVFVRRSPTDGIRTGVGMLLDMSSSMTVDCRNMAQAMAAIALGDACTRGGADVAMWGFGPCPSLRGGDYQRCQWGGVLIPFKQWQDSMDTGAARLAGTPSSHGTNLCPAIVAASREMAARTGLDKRILLVMTDGDCRFGRPALHATAAWCEAKYGVILIGVGIQCDVGDAFPKSVRIDRMATFATETMKALVKVVG